MYMFTLTWGGDRKREVDAFGLLKGHKDPNAIISINWSMYKKLC